MSSQDKATARPWRIGIDRPAYRCLVDSAHVVVDTIGNPQLTICPICPCTEHVGSTMEPVVIMPHGEAKARLNHFEEMRRLFKETVKHLSDESDTDGLSVHDYDLLEDARALLARLEEESNG